MQANSHDSLHTSDAAPSSVAYIAAYMTDKTVYKEVKIDAPVNVVWQFVGTQEGLQQWWGMQIAFTPRVGGACEEQSLYRGSVLCQRGRVTSYAPPHHLALLLHHDRPAVALPRSTTISLSLRAEGEGTLVTVIHHAFSERDDETASFLAQEATMQNSLDQMRHDGASGAEHGAPPPAHRQLPTAQTAHRAAFLPWQEWQRYHESHWRLRLNLLDELST